MAFCTPSKAIAHRFLIAVSLWCSLSTQHTVAQNTANGRCNAEVCCCVRNYRSGGWEVLESANFRVHYVGQATLARQLITDCEHRRWNLQKQWLHATRQTAWALKCDVYCYPSGREYARLTKNPEESWGHVDLEIGSGQVWRRRLNLRSDLAARLTTVAAHELTHVILADVFCNKQIPRWADEGIAVHSEPTGRQVELRQKLSEALKQGRRFSFQELTSAANYPADPEIVDLFYAQSAAWIEFLTSQKNLSGPQILKIVSSISDQGLHVTLQTHFPGLTLSTLEEEWQAWIETKPLLADKS